VVLLTRSAAPTSSHGILGRWVVLEVYGPQDWVPLPLLLNWTGFMFSLFARRKLLTPMQSTTPTSLRVTDSRSVPNFVRVAAHAFQAMAKLSGRSQSAHSLRSGCILTRPCRPSCCLRTLRSVGQTSAAKYLKPAEAGVLTNGACARAFSPPCLRANAPLCCDFAQAPWNTISSGRSRIIVKRVLSFDGCIVEPFPEAFGNQLGSGPRNCGQQPTRSRCFREMPHPPASSAPVP